MTHFGQKGVFYQHLAKFQTCQSLNCLKAKESNAGKGFGKPQPKPKKKKPQLIQPKLQSESEPESKPSKPFDSQLNRQLGTADKVEETIVRTLAFLFVVFFFEGVFLAIAVRFFSLDPFCLCTLCLHLGMLPIFESM